MLTEITDEASGLNNYHIGSYDADILYGWEVTFKSHFGLGEKGEI